MDCAPGAGACGLGDARALVFEVLELELWLAGAGTEVGKNHPKATPSGKVSLAKYTVYAITVIS